jgi:16S rRNA (guanine527-N7)-methyltransferase
VKQSTPAEHDLRDRLLAMCEAAAIDLEPQGAATLVRYLLGVLELNRQLNLTRITDPLEATRLHLLDSLSALPEVCAAAAGTGLDLGSGAGFPGVPLSVASGREFMLLDSANKKAAAVASLLATSAMGELQIDVCGRRAEEYANEHPGGFALVVARAVAPLPSLVELAAPLLRVGGVLVALKGCPESSERESGAAAAAIVGLTETSARALTLPGGDERRTIITYTRTGASRVKLPRRTGLAQHRPLA